MDNISYLESWRVTVEREVRRRRDKIESEAGGNAGDEMIKNQRITL